MNVTTKDDLSSGIVQSNCQAPFTRYNLLSNRLSKWFDNRVNVCIHDATGCQTRCQTGCTTRFDNRLNEQLFVQHGCQTVFQHGCQTVFVKPVCQTRFDNRLFVQHGCQTRLTTVLTTDWMLFTRYSRLLNRLYNLFDNRLYRLNGVSHGFYPSNASYRGY